MWPLNLFLANMANWARSQNHIAAVALVGSHARGMPRQDSDIDIVIVSKTPHTLLVETGRIEQFGVPVSIQREDYGLVTSLRAVYTDRPEVEFGITGPEWCTSPIDPNTARVMADGLRPVYDPHNLLLRAINEIQENK